MNAQPKNPHIAPLVALHPDVAKVLAAVSLLIHEAEVRGCKLTQYEIVKSIFLADRSQLNKLGRPITFDNYVAMRHGPVPSLAYDLLKLNRVVMGELNITSVPWQREPAEELGPGCFCYFGASTEGISEVLSPNDMSALRDALVVVSSLTFSQIRELTHGDAAYKEAWTRGESQNSLMSLGLLYDLPDFEAAEELQYVSQQKNQNVNDSDELDSILEELERRDRFIAG